MEKRAWRLGEMLGGLDSNQRPSAPKGILPTGENAAKYREYVAKSRPVIVPHRSESSGEMHIENAFRASKCYHFCRLLPCRCPTTMAESASAVPRKQRGRSHAPAKSRPA